MRYFFVLIFFLSLSCFADVYQHVDTNGVTYSDTPLNSKATKLITPEETPTKTDISAPIVESRKNVTNKVKHSGAVSPEEMRALPKKKPYDIFVIASPKDQETIQNEPTIAVDISIKPELQEDDKIQVYLDGQPWGEPAATTHFSLSDVVRGSHQIYATIMGAAGVRIKQTPAITIFVHRASALNRHNQ